eukprot:4214527-Pleurochrysis_carterae.AAC.1
MDNCQRRRVKGRARGVRVFRALSRRDDIVHRGGWVGISQGRQSLEERTELRPTGATPSARSAPRRSLCRHVRC